MEGLSDVLNMMRPGIWMASVDLRDAYYSISVHQEDQKFFSFAWEEKYYQFICLPNGYKDGPRVFTKVLKALLPICEGKVMHQLLTLMTGTSKLPLTKSVVGTFNVLLPFWKPWAFLSVTNQF